MENLDRKLTEATTAGPGMVTPGVVVKVVDRHGITLYNASSGTYGLDRTEKVHENTQMWLASETKILTAAMAMKLVEDGLWKLNDPVDEVLPELKAFPIVDNEGKVAKQANNNITLRHLLTHSSGMTYPNMHPGVSAWREQKGIASPGFGFLNDPLEKFMSGPLIYEPGHGWGYSPGLDWAGILISRVAKVSLEEYLQQKICKPLGMTSTTFAPSDPEKLMTISNRGDDGALAAMPLPLRLPTSLFYGGHGCFSTVADYTKFLTMLLRDGEGANGVRVLKKETVDEMFTPQLNDDASKMLKETVAGPLGPLMGPSVSLERNKHVNLNYGLSGIINLDDYADARKAGSMAWSGMPNLYWWVDRKSGIVANVGTQLFPYGDGQIVKLVQEVEDEVYKTLVK